MVDLTERLNVTLTYKEELLANLSEGTSMALTCLTTRHGFRIKLFDNGFLRWITVIFLFLIIFILFLYNVALWVTLFYVKYQKLPKRENGKYKRSQFINWISFNLISTSYIILLTAKFIVDLMVYHGYNGISTYSQDLMFYVILMTGLTTGTGYYYIMFQGMVKHTAHFILLYTLVAIPFVVASERILMHNIPAENCVLDFTLPINMIYTFVLMLLNSFNTVAEVTEHDTDPNIVAAVQLLHTVFIFISVIVLINFLIALFSSTANEIINTKDIHLLIGRLYVSSNFQNY